MRAIITRNMTVANAKGEAETFEANDEPVTIDDVGTFNRLNRAGAAIVAPGGEDGSAETLAPRPVGVGEMTVTHDANGKPAAGGGVERIEAGGSGHGEGFSAGNGGDGIETGKAETVDIDKLNKADLSAYATEHGIAFDEADTKAVILEKVKASSKV
jgi:hypothetical protein